MSLPVCGVCEKKADAGMETVQSQKHKPKSKHSAKADCGASNNHAAGNYNVIKDTSLIMKCVANREELQSKKTTCIWETLFMSIVSLLFLSNKCQSADLAPPVCLLNDCFAKSAAAGLEHFSCTDCLIQHASFACAFICRITFFVLVPPGSDSSAVMCSQRRQRSLCLPGLQNTNIEMVVFFQWFYKPTFFLHCPLIFKLRIDTVTVTFGAGSKLTALQYSWWHSW